MNDFLSVHNLLKAESSEVDTFDGIEMRFINDSCYSFLTELFGYRLRLKVFHWETMNMNRHKMIDKFVSIYDDFVDSLVEGLIALHSSEDSIYDDKTFRIDGNKMVSLPEVKSFGELLCRFDVLLSEFTLSNHEPFRSMVDSFREQLLKYRYLNRMC